MLLLMPFDERENNVFLDHIFAFKIFIYILQARNKIHKHDNVKMFFQCHDDDTGVVDGKYKRYSTILFLM